MRVLDVAGLGWGAASLDVDERIELLTRAMEPDDEA